MPLSEDEQRILRQIEEQLQADPSFALKVNQRSRVPHPGHRLLWSVLGLVGGLAVAILALQVSAWLSFVAFGGMLVSGVYLERELTARGRDQMQGSKMPWQRNAANSPVTWTVPSCASTMPSASVSVRAVRRTAPRTWCSAACT